MNGSRLVSVQIKTSFESLGRYGNYWQHGTVVFMANTFNTSVPLAGISLLKKKDTKLVHIEG